MAERILIATPCAHATVKMGTMTSVAYSCLAFASQGAQVNMISLAGVDVVFMRNYMAGIALRDGYSHIFFVDSDMAFPAALALGLLRSRREVVGLVCPRRKLDLGRVIRLSRDHPQASTDAIVSMSQDYAIRLLEPAAFTDGFAKVAGVGMAITLIATSVLQRMIDVSAVTQHDAKMNVEDTTVPVWSFFDPVPSERGGMLSEDYSFCKRWTDIGGDVWALAAAGVEHIGDFHFTGNILTKGTDTPPTDPADAAARVESAG